MQALVVRDAALQLEERAIPQAGSEQVLVRVHATAVNRADLLQVRGHYPAPPGAPADIPGLEYAGVVERVGSAVTRWRAGDRVMGLVGGGGYAEYVVVHQHEALPVPASLTLTEAAAVPEAFITAHDALFTQAALRDGETVLVHAVASGVGTAAVQLAHASGCRTIGTTRSPEKVEPVRALGCDDVVLADAAWPERVLELTGGRGVDVVLELVGGEYVSADLRVLSPRGRLLLVGLVAGREAMLDLGAVLRKRLTLIGTVMRARSLEEKIATAAAFARDVLPLLDAGTVHPVVDRVLRAEQAGGAHALLADNTTTGKLVLSWTAEGARGAR